MARFQIPKSFLSGFDLLASLTTEETNEIVDILKNMPVGTGANTFENSFAENHPHWAETMLAQTVYSLGTFKGSDYTEIPNSDTIKDLVESYATLGEEKQPEDLDRLKHNLAIIFDHLDNLASTFKAYKLMSENGRTFTGSNIVSDIRLVFNKELSDTNKGALIVHQLKITSEENYNIKEYFFSMDTADLVKLKNQIERAEEKDKLIRNQFESVMSFISITD